MYEKLDLEKITLLDESLMTILLFRNRGGADLRGPNPEERQDREGLGLRRCSMGDLHLLEGLHSRGRAGDPGAEGSAEQAGEAGEASKEKGGGVMEESIWHGQIAARNTGMKAALAAREAKREAVQARKLAPTDSELLAQVAHQVSFESKPERELKGASVPRKLPNWAIAAIDALPPGDPIRAARDRGDVKYDFSSGKWKVYGPGIPAASEKEPVGPGHLPKLFFAGTARRERERKMQR